MVGDVAICATLACAVFVFASEQSRVWCPVFVSHLGDMDTVADMLNTLVNAQRVGKERIAVPHSRFKEQLVRLLHERGLVAAVRVQEAAKSKLIITLAYEDGVPKVRQITRLSKPGRRLYVSHGEIPWSSSKYAMYVVSTSEGLFDERDARAKGLGGELICEVCQ